MVLYTFTIVNIKKRPTLSAALHTAWTHVLSQWIMPFSTAYLLQQDSNKILLLLLLFGIIAFPCKKSSLTDHLIPIQPESMFTGALCCWALYEHRVVFTIDGLIAPV